MHLKWSWSAQQLVPYHYLIVDRLVLWDTTEVFRDRQSWIRTTFLKVFLFLLIKYEMISPSPGRWIEKTRTSIQFLSIKSQDFTVLPCWYHECWFCCADTTKANSTIKESQDFTVLPCWYHECWFCCADTTKANSTIKESQDFTVLPCWYHECWFCCADTTKANSTISLIY